MFLRRNKFVLLLLIFWFSLGSARSFPINSKQQCLVGSRAKVAQLRSNDTFSSLGQRFDLGYYPLFEANQGADPDNPLPGSVLILPSRYILPEALNLTKNNIVVNLAELRLYFYSATQHKVYIFPIGIGREGWMTPVGKFTIIKKIVNPTWEVPTSIRKFRAARGQPVQSHIDSGPTDPLGYYAMRLSNYSYLIHGTDDPVGIGRRSSAGCIRMYGADVKKLFAMVKVGIPVAIIDQPYKVCFEHNKLYFEAHLPLYEQRLKYHGDVTPAVEVVKKIATAHKLTIDKHQVLGLAKLHMGMPLVLKTKPNKVKEVKKAKKVSSSSSGLTGGSRKLGKLQGLDSPIKSGNDGVVKPYHFTALRQNRRHNR